jgi:hypothetical protein
LKVESKNILLILLKAAPPALAAPKRSRLRRRFSRYSRMKTIPAMHFFNKKCVEGSKNLAGYARSRKILLPPRTLFAK